MSIQTLGINTPRCKHKQGATAGAKEPQPRAHDESLALPTAPSLSVKEGAFGRQIYGTEKNKVSLPLSAGLRISKRGDFRG